MAYFEQDTVTQETSIETMKKTVVVMSVILVAACAGTNRPSYSVNEILLVNNSREVLREVKVSVPSTRRSFSCGSVAPLGICGNKIPRRRYEYNPIRVEWTFGNRSRSTGEFIVQVPDTFSAELPLRGVLAVSQDGSIEAYFEQDPRLN